MSQEAHYKQNLAELYHGRFLPSATFLAATPCNPAQGSAKTRFLKCPASATLRKPVKRSAKTLS
jgi:hypothetical protein